MQSQAAYVTLPIVMTEETQQKDLFWLIALVLYGREDLGACRVAGVRSKVLSRPDGTRSRVRPGERGIVL